MKTLIPLLLLLFPISAMAEVTLNLSLGQPLHPQSSYYGSSTVGMVDLCYRQDMTKRVDFVGCGKHISKLGRDDCATGPCYGDNWATAGFEIILFK